MGRGELCFVGKSSSDTLVRLGNDAGFEDVLRAGRKVMMAYFWAFPVLGALCLYNHEWLAGKVLAWGLILAVGTLILLRLVGMLIRIELVMDRERQQLLLRRRILGFTHLVSLAGVEELWAVVTAGEVPAAPVNYWWDYVTLLITRSGRRFRAARHGVDFNVADRATHALGAKLGIEILASQESHKARVIPGKTQPSVKLTPYNLRTADCMAVFFWGVMVFITPLLFFALILAGE